MLKVFTSTVCKIIVDVDDIIVRTVIISEIH